MAVEFCSTSNANLDWGTGSDPSNGPISITVPSDCTAVYLVWAFYSASTGGIATTSLGAEGAADELVELSIGDSGEPATGVAVWYNPATGTQNIDLTWDVSPDGSTGGPVSSVIYVKGGDTTDPQWSLAPTPDQGDGTGADQANGSTAISATVDSSATDLCVRYEQEYSGIPGLETGFSDAPTAPTQSVLRGMAARLSTADSPGATVTANGQTPNYSTLVVFSIPEGAAAGGGVIVPVLQRKIFRHNLVR